MKVNVMMASGDSDEWEDAADAVDDRGSLVVLYEIEGDEIPYGTKVLEVSREMDDGSTMGQTFQVAAQYAPGMWMKVEFE